jgi:hypothetical protein
MNVQDNGTPRRPKLSLPFGRPRAENFETTPGLSGSDLRRIVAAMIG